MLQDSEGTNAIISIYNTLTDEANWRETLDICSEYVGASSAGLVITDESDDAPYEDRYLSSRYHQVDPDKLQYYRDHLRKYEHMAWDILKSIPPQTILSDDKFREQVAQQEDFVFFREVLGVDRRMVCRINDHPAWFDALAFQFDAKLHARPDGCEDKFRVILPHLAHTLQIGRTFWKLQREYKMVLGVLNHVNIGLCVAYEGELVVVNQEAENIFHLADGISCNERKKISLHGSALQDELNSAITEMSVTAQGKGVTTAKQFLIARPSGEESFVLEVTPLRDALGEVAKNMAGALISIINPSNTMNYDFARFAKVFALTEAEQAVCKLIVGGYSNQEISEKRSVSEKTIKNQATNIYKKTETNSRASLVRKIVMTTPPLILK